jgi:3-hydroxybutyryl-CoA dehydrogenase
MDVEDVSSVAVLGAGIMGSGIAQVFAQAGYEVWLYSRTEKTLKNALDRIKHNQQTLITYHFLSPQAAREAMSRISTTTDLVEAVDGVDLVNENLPEMLELKREVFKSLGEISLPETLLTTDTSGLSITEIAEQASFPERVAGLHWWNPPHIVPLVEIVRGEQTSDETVNTLHSLVEKLGKRPVVVKKDIPGFIGNRIQSAVVREVLALLEDDVADPQDIDTVMRYGPGFRYPAIGPVQAMDLAGLDTVMLVSDYLFKELDRSTKPSRLIKKLNKEGRLGAKTGAGIYDYTEESLLKTIRERDEMFIKLLELNRETQR